MQPWVKSKKSTTSLAVVLLVGLLGLLLAERTKERTHYHCAAQQIEAAALMEQCLKVISRERLALGIPVDRELDPNGTGLIGLPLTEITTSLGNLEAKRTSTNPEFAALLVRYFCELGMQKGDFVAVGASGSFPGLILAALSAAKVMELRPLVIYSIGASMYGANIPQFTFIDMLRACYREELLFYRLLAVSLGGDDDLAKNPLLDGAEEVFAQIANSSGAPLISEPDNGASIRRRWEIYHQAAEGQPLACFINIGGASPNHGTTTASLHFPNGLVTQPPEAPDHLEAGLIFDFAQAGVPVIHLLDIRNLAQKAGVAVDPVPLPPLGRGEVYFTVKYRKDLILLFLFGMGACLLIPSRRTRENNKAVGEI